MLSDGEENREPYLRNVLPSVMKQGVTINSLEFGAEADTGQRELALGTAGDFYVSDNKGEEGFITEVAFMESLTAKPEEEKDPVWVS